MFSLIGRVAIVSGAGQGIRRGIAEVFARSGATALVLTRTETRGAEAVKHLCAQGAGAAGR